MPSSLPVPSFLRGALRRLPVETAVIALAAVTAIHAVHTDFTIWHARLSLLAVLAMPLAFAFHERAGDDRRRAIFGGAAITALLTLVVLLILPEPGSVYEPASKWAILLLVPAAYLIPFVAAAPRFSLFVRRFFEELTTWTLLGGLSAAAIGVTCYAIEQLFELRTERVAADLILLTAGAITLVVLDRLLPDRAASGKIPELWRKLAVAVGAPFVTAILIILVAYEASVIVRGELPRNILSPLLIAAGFTGYLCTLILTSVAAEPVGTAALSPAEPHRFLRNRSVQIARAFPLVLLPLLPMALWAVTVRIEQYGLTPFRVVRVAALLCLVVLGVLGTMRWLRGRAALGWHVPATVAVFALAISLGPTSAVRLSIASQTARLERLLTRAGIANRTTNPEHATASLLLDNERWNELDTAVSDLAELGGTSAMQRLFSGDVTACAYRYSSDSCLRSLGVAPAYKDITGSYITTHTRSLQSPVTIPSGSATFLSFSAFDEPTGADHQPDTVSLSCGDGYARASLAHLLDSADPDAPLPATPIPLLADNPACTAPGVLVLDQLFTVDDERGRRASRLEGLWIR